MQVPDAVVRHELASGVASEPRSQVVHHRLGRTEPSLPDRNVGPVELDHQANTVVLLEHRIIGDVNDARSASLADLGMGGNI
ncbi:hypothetical protein BH23ACT4_BH23ACT4_14930 [soil metagenome]